MPTGRCDALITVKTPDDGREKTSYDCLYDIKIGKAYSPVSCAKMCIGGMKRADAYKSSNLGQSLTNPSIANNYLSRPLPK